MQGLSIGSSIAKRHQANGLWPHMNKQLNSASQRTYERIFQHPITYNLERGEVRKLFSQLGEVENEHNGNMKVTVGGQVLTFQAASDSEVVSPDEVVRIRTFIKNTEALTAEELGHHLLLVIDHLEARIFRTELKDSMPELLTPYDPRGYKTHVHSSHDFAGPAEHPNNNAYFEHIAESLNDAEQILVFGSGTGSSGTMEAFVEWLRIHKKKISERVLQAVTVDQSHLTDGQLLEKAREIYCQR
jgi:hypothetical protein